MKRKTQYAKLGLQLVHHHRAALAGEAAMGVYAFLVMYSRLEELDGFVPGDIAYRCWTGDKGNVARLARLTEVGLIRVVDGGYEVVNFAQFNETKEDVTKRKQQVRERVTRYRGDEKRVTDAFVPSLSPRSGSDPERNTDPERQAAPRPVGPAVTGAQSFAPEDIPVDEDLKGRCAMQGVRVPTPKDIRAALTWAKDRGRTSADWKSFIVSWMRRAPQFAQDAPGRAFGGPNGSQVVQSRQTPSAADTAFLLKQHDAWEQEAVPPPEDLMNFDKVAGGGR